MSLHFSFAQTITNLDKTIGDRGFTMINMGNNGKVSNVLHAVNVYQSKEERTLYDSSPKFK
ncbi:hypothetical protein NMY25_000275 [Wohlfahrtiimonas chitiniclastica]|nr:hypothetical protein [Wohlfahrtiimonas chitiniclastica]